MCDNNHFRRHPLLFFFSGGVKFDDIDLEQANKFQEDVLKTIIQLEDTFIHLASKGETNCLIVCDRGTMDASACKSLHWNKIET